MRDRRERLLELGRVLQQKRTAAGEHGKFRKKRRRLLANGNGIDQRVAAGGGRNYFRFGGSAVAIVAVGKQYERLSSGFRLETIERGDDRITKRSRAPRIERGDSAFLRQLVGGEWGDDVGGAANAHHPR